MERDVLLLQPELGEGRSGRDAHLRLHEVDIRHLFGDRVLDLDPRVHLDEDVLARALPRRVDEELDGPGVHVRDRPGEGDGVAVDALPEVVVEVRRGSDLDDLLVAALHRAVPLEEVHRLAGGIREDLHLDVPRTNDRLLEEHPRVAEGGARLAHRLGDGGRQLARRLDTAHAASAAAGDGLDEDREPDPLRLRDELIDVVGCRSRGEHGNARGDRVLLGGDLVAGHPEHGRGRPDEGDPVLSGAGGEVGVLREEAVTRVDRIGARRERDPDDLVDIEIRTHGMPRLADLVGLVGLLPVQ